jgi:RNA polymerase sigma-70 factor (ECF subfamily)
MAMRYSRLATVEAVASGRGGWRRWGQILGCLALRLSDGSRDGRVTLESQAGELAPSDARAISAPGDLPDFEAFFRAHERAIFSYLYRMTGDEQAAYDLSQETFVRAWQRYDRLSGYEQPLAWLFRVATNLALNHQRDRASPVRAALSLDADLDPAGSDPSWRFAERDAIREALLAMAPRQRAALALREVYGFSGEEVAAALGISHAAAKMLLSRAREQFRAQYHKEEPR